MLSTYYVYSIPFLLRGYLFSIFYYIINYMNIMRMCEILYEY